MNPNKMQGLLVFSDFAYKAQQEILKQQIGLFNQAAGGVIVLRDESMRGDFHDNIQWAFLDGLVKERNPYGNAANPTLNLKQVAETAVKVSLGTGTVLLNAERMKYILRNPEEEGVVLGRYLAEQRLAKMLNTSLGVLGVALGNQTEVVKDYSAQNGTADLRKLVETAALFGDHSGAIKAWVMHSKPFTDMQLNAYDNGQRLFTFGNVTIFQDIAGRLIFQTDSPTLVQGGTFNVLGLVAGAMELTQNDDFDSNVEKSNGRENIESTYQAQWSYNMRLKGFSWDKESGGAAPNDAALMSAANWDRWVTSHKDLAGVLLKVK